MTSPGPADHEAEASYVLIARGEFDVQDRQLIAQLLGRLGASTEFMPEVEYKAYLDRLRTVIIQEVPVPRETTNETVSFADITSPDQFLIREHFEDFKAVYSSTYDLSRNFTGLVFNSLIDGRGRVGRASYVEAGKRRFRNPVPAPFVAILPRSDLGYAPYNDNKLNDWGKGKICAQYGVQAGSIVTYAGLIDESTPLNNQKSGIIAVADQLKDQFVD